MRIPYLAILYLFFYTVQLSAQVKYNVHSYDILNTRYNEFGAVRIGEDSIVFCSDKPQESLITKKDSVGNYFFKPYLFDTNRNKITRFLPHYLKSDLNIGPFTINPSKDKILFSQNTTSYNKGKSSKIPLGIYIIKKVNGEWQKPKPLLVDKEFNYAHPAFVDDNTFVFSKSKINDSNKDLYLAKTNAQDSVILEKKLPVNTTFAEVFPYYDLQSKILYFSSNKEGNYDVYYTQTDLLNYQPVAKLDTSINSLNDEVSFFIRNNKGFFARNNKKNNFDIFEFEKQFLIPESCDSSVKINFCYDFFEASAMFSANDTFPIIYEWNFGDGNTSEGLHTSHCYSKPGIYKISLNAIDTVINQVFYNEANYMLEIPEPQNPSINIKDTLTINKLYIINPDTAFSYYNPKNKFYWIIDNDEINEKWYFTHYFQTSGQHKIQFVYYNDSITKSVCKNVVVVDSSEVKEEVKKLKILESDENTLTLINMDDEGFVLPEDYFLNNQNDSLVSIPIEDSSAISIQKNQLKGKQLKIIYKNKQQGFISKDENNRYKYKILNPDSNTIKLILIEDEDLLILTTIQDSAFVKQTLKGLKSNNDVMQCIVTDDEVLNSSLFHQFQTMKSKNKTYKILNISDINSDSLYTLINTLINDTISFSIRKVNPNSLINEELDVADELQNLSNNDSLALKINSLYYDFNKYEIEEYMLNDLHQILRYIKENPTFKIVIEAHTDNVGSEHNNIKLSNMRAEKVKEFLVKNGVNPQRIQTKGMGSKHPIAPNDTEENRAKNRRVIIKFIK